MYFHKEKQSQSKPITVLTMNSEVVENYKWSDIYAALKEKNKGYQNEKIVRLFYYASLIFKQAAKTNEFDVFTFFVRRGSRVKQIFGFGELFKECLEKNPFTESEPGTTSDMYSFGVELNDKGEFIIDLPTKRYNLTKFNMSKFSKIFERFKNLFDENVQKLLCEKTILDKYHNINYSVIDVLGGYFIYKKYENQ